jgi:hypothetical protein
MKNQSSLTHDCRVARVVAAEDLRCGDFVGILTSIVELPSFFWGADCQVAPPHEPVRLRCRPAEGGVPLKIKAICLPFVLVRTPDGRHQTLDIRQCELVRLDAKYAQAASKALCKTPGTSRR